MSHERLSSPPGSSNQINNYGYDTLAAVPFAGNSRPEKPTISEILGKEKRIEFAAVCRPYTNEVLFNTVRAWDVLEAHKSNFKRGVTELRDWLAETFQIEPPELVFRPTGDTDSAGQFSGNEYKITFYYDARRSRRGDLDDLNTIAHEMWHALQLNKANYGDDERSELYDINFDCYFSSEDNEEFYGRQLIEDEAFYFGDKIERIFQSHLDQGQDIVTAFKRTFRKENFSRPNVVDGYLQSFKKR